MADRKRIKEKFLRAERERTRKRVEVAAAILADVLENDFGRQLWGMKRADQLRLLILFGWRDKHSLGIAWMLRRLIPIWHRRFSRFKRSAAHIQQAAGL